MGLMVALVLLAVTLAAAIARPFGVTEAVVAVPAAALCVAGLLHADTAWDEIDALAPTLGFLAAVLVLGRLCALEGLFRWAGAVLSRAAGTSPGSLLGWVLLVGTAITTVLSLDATVVLFTPVVVAAAGRRWPCGPAWRFSALNVDTGEARGCRSAAPHPCRGRSLVPVLRRGRWRTGNPHQVPCKPGIVRGTAATISRGPSTITRAMALVHLTPQGNPCKAI